MQLPLPTLPTFIRPGWPPLYGVPSQPGLAVTVTGEVWSCKRGEWRQLKPITRPATIKHRTYIRVSVRPSGGQPRQLEIHRLVAEAFLGPLPYGYETHHKDEDNWNNRADNIVYLSHDDHKAAHRDSMTDDDWAACI